MAFKQSDINHVDKNVWNEYEGWLETPCNVMFASNVQFQGVQTCAHLEALMSELRRCARSDAAPAAGFSIIQKENGWKIVQEYIKKFPKKFQTVTTDSRHGKYKVMWVFFKANGRQF